jgi:twitching motility protein PilU
MPPDPEEHCHDQARHVHSVGATGSGKSTSLAAMVDWRNENTFDHIITVEDPVEFVHQHKNCIITQREVGVDTDDWEIALKNTLRQAPDVILMGEIRDRETMEHAIVCRNRPPVPGHAARQQRQPGVGPHRQLLPREERHAQMLMDLSLNTARLVSQRLLPKQDGKGRYAVVEILLNSPLIADLDLKGEINEIKEVMKKAANIGMQTFDQALFDAFEANLITYEEAIRNADSQNDLKLNIKLNSQRARTTDLAAGTEHLTII